MKTKLALITLLLLPLTAMAVPNTTWKKIKTRQGVDVFEGQVPNSKVVAIRGTSIIDAPIEHVASAIHDPNTVHEWVSDLKETRILEKPGMFEKIEYNETNAPWPLSNRDFVYSVKIAADKTTKTLKILLKNATHKNAPLRNNIVRGELKESEYILKSIDGGKKTQITVELFADPKGKIPKWIVNLFQRAWPSNTIAGIRKLATRPGMTTHPDIVQFMKNLKL